MLQEIITALGLSQEPKITTPHDKQAQIIERLSRENQLMRKQLEAQAQLLKLFYLENMQQDAKLRRYDQAWRY
jgi:hypothetical protein